MCLHDTTRQNFQITPTIHIYIIFMNLSFYQAAELIEKAIAMPGLSSLQKIEISLSCSYLFQQFGLRRKFIYMLFRTVSLYLEAGDVRAAVHVLILIAELSCAGFRGRNEDKDNQRLDIIYMN